MVESEDDKLTTATNVETVDDIYDQIGGCGRYQWIFGALVQINTLMWVGSHNFYTFGMLQPPACDLVGINSTDSCNCGNASRDQMFYSFAQEFDLDCQGKGYLPTLLISISQAVMAPLLLIAGHTSDRFVGRRTQLIVSVAATTGFFLLSTLSTSFEMVMVFVVLASASQAFADPPTAMFPKEIVPKNSRILMSCASQYAVMYAVSALLAYLTANWRYYTVAWCLGSSPAIAGFIFMTESPRWQIQKNKIKEASESLNKIARINGMKKNQEIDILTPENLAHFKNGSSDGSGPRRYSVLDLFKTKDLTLITITQCVSMFNIGSIGSIILYGAGQLAGNIFLHIALYGILRLWVPPLLYYIDRRSIKFGRKILIEISLVILLICLVANAFILQVDTAKKYIILVTIFAQIAVITNASWFAIGVYTVNAEVFPTVVRNVGQSVTAIAGTMGRVVGPQLIYMIRFWPITPYLVLGVTCAINLMMVVTTLPETKGVSLPEVIIDRSSKSKDVILGDFDNCEENNI